MQRAACGARQVRTLVSGDLAALERIIGARASCRHFDGRAVPPELLARILAITQRSPSGFNLQPWHVVIVDSPAAKRALAGGMLGGNGDRVLAAPLSAVFVADTEPLESGRLERVVAAEKEAGRPSAYLRNLPFDAAVSLGRGGRSGGGGSGAAEIARVGLLSLGSLLMPLPDASVSREAWAFKQAGLAAMSYMLAATAAGLGTHAMEGLVPATVRTALGLPRSMSIPLVIATGYTREAEGRAEAPHAQEPSVGQAGVMRSPRLDAAFLFRHNSFQTPWRTGAAN
jgi:nitroreductase